VISATIDRCRGQEDADSETVPVDDDRSPGFRDPLQQLCGRCLGLAQWRDVLGDSEIRHQNTRAI